MKIVKTKHEKGKRGKEGRCVFKCVCTCMCVCGWQSDRRWLAQPEEDVWEGVSGSSGAEDRERVGLLGGDIHKWIKRALLLYKHIELMLHTAMRVSNTLWVVGNTLWVTHCAPKCVMHALYFIKKKQVRASFQWSFYNPYSNIMFMCLWLCMCECVLKRRKKRRWERGKERWRAAADS